MKKLLAAGLVVCGASMWSCESIDNDRLTVGREASPSLEPAGAHGLLEQAGGPSLVSGGRGHWEEQQIIVRVDGTEHHPHYTTPSPRYAKTERALGRHPTAETALELKDTSGAEVAEAAAGPFHAATDVIMLIPRMIATPPGKVIASPVVAYQRGSAADAPGGDSPETERGVEGPAGE
ncbi:MAG: hypothetical protein SFZ24_10485 [Planctomycetota bacterium]|nr:hypothetical protein [Planctomycetota bacterium]